jgi:hypothetical protein
LLYNLTLVFLAVTDDTVTAVNIDSLEGLEHSSKQIIRSNSMKTIYTIVLLAFLGLAILGCSDSSNPIATTVDKASTLNFTGSLDKDNGILHSATGSAHWRSVPITGETNFRISFTAIQHKDGTITGELVAKDKGIMYGKAKVYGLEVSGNMAKLAFHYTNGNLGAMYYPPVDISDIYGWLVVIDNGQGGNTTGPDLVSLIVFTDGSDILPLTIAELDPMGPQEYLNTMGDYLFQYYGIPYDAFLSPYENGSVQVR